MQILNKTVNMRNDVCYRVSSEGRVADVNNEFVENVIETFEELRKNEKSISNVEDLHRANVLSREKRVVRIRKLQDEQTVRRNAGFALISSVTVIGTLVMGMLIFMIIKMVVFG